LKNKTNGGFGDEKKREEVFGGNYSEGGISLKMDKVEI